MAGYIGSKAVNLSTTGADINGNANIDGDLSFRDNDKAIFGAGSDLKIYHDGDNSYIDEAGVGALFIRGHSQVRITDTSSNIAAIFRGDAESTLYHNNSPKIATTSTGANITGELSLATRITVNGGTGYGSIELGGDNGAFIDLKEPLNEDFNARIIYNDANGFILGGNTNIPVKLAYGGVGTGNVKLATTSTGISVTGNATFGDNDKAIFGAGSDLTISHDTTGTVGSYITETGSGSLNIRGNNVIFANSDGSEEYGKFFNGAGVEFNYANATKLATTATGIDVTGNATFADNGKAIFGAGSDLQIYHDGSDSIITDAGTGNLIVKTNGNNIQFEDGSGNDIFKVTPTATNIYHGTSGVKLATTSTGIDVTGTGTAIDLRSNNNSGTALNTLRFTDTDGSASANQEIGKIEFYSSDSSTPGAGVKAEIVGVSEVGNPGSRLEFKTDTTTGTPIERMRINRFGDISFYEDTGTTPKMVWKSADERLGIGTTSPEALLDVAYNLPDDTHGVIRPLKVRTTDTSNETNLFADDGVGILFEIPDQTSSSIGASIDAVKESSTDDNISTVLSFKTSANNETLNEAMRIDSSGNVLVGKLSGTIASQGHELRSAANGGWAGFTNDGERVAFFNRMTSDGQIAVFRKDNVDVGSIGINGGRLYINGDNGSSGGGLKLTATDARPVDRLGNDWDNNFDLGDGGTRFDDIYATNTSIIGTSDRREKQDIAELDEAEQRVAVACKGLLRKFRWKDAVAKKGDDARIHFGIIAQDLQAAFAAEGLDAGRYGMFIHNTWWEHDVEVPAVEAVDAYTRTDTYDTQEEAPEGAVERDRMGVRMTEILAFIIGAL